MDPQRAIKHDIRDWIDDKIFKQWLSMNRTEIVGYRRLRTLSQLLFETMPQIVLQLHILRMVKWSRGNNDEFDIDIEALTMSIVLAVVHLIFEGGMIFLDSSAFKMSFIEYSLECLGGRIQWIPFQHLIENLIQNQLYIYRDCDHKRFNKEHFDAISYDMNQGVHNTAPNQDTSTANEIPMHGNVDDILILDFENITTDVFCNCMQYSASYQFSPQSMNKLIQMTNNCPPIIIPAEFKLSSTIIPLQNLMKQILCRVKIKLDAFSFGSADIIAFCQLFTASHQKIQLDINNTQIIRYLLQKDKINEKIVVQSIFKSFNNNTSDNHENGTDGIANAIKQTLIYHGQSQSIQWICNNISHRDQLSDIKSFILMNALSLDNGDNNNVKLDILRNCYKHKLYLGSSCKTMEAINEVIEQCYIRCKQDEIWYFVIIFMLLYTRGRIFGENCINRCSHCRLRLAIKNQLSTHWIPSQIEIGAFKMSYKVFENCELYQDKVEAVLLNQCKNYIISRDKDNLRKSVIVSDGDIAKYTIKRCRYWEQFNGQSLEDIQQAINALIVQIQEKRFDENIALLDELMQELHMSSNYNEYLSKTINYREAMNQTTTISRSEANVNTHEITLDELMEQNFDQSQRFQIYEIEITATTDEFVIYFTVDDRSTYLWDPSTDNKRQSVFIGLYNVGLMRYNTHLLYTEDVSIPSILIDSTEIFDVTINVSYTRLFSSIDHERLDEIRFQKLQKVMKDMDEMAKENINIVGMYKFGRTIGSGASCRVVEALHKNNTENVVAIKIMDKETTVSKKLYTREVSVLERLTPDISQPHRGVVPFIGHGEDDDSYYIVMRLLRGGELFDRIVTKDDKYKITERIAVKMVLTMLETVKYCHDQNVIHRDLKPENFVFATDAVDSDIVLIDFGCARIVQDDEIIEDVVGTAYYLAPELAAAALENYRKKGSTISGRAPPSKPRTGRILKAADVWSMGVIAYVMMTGRAPFRGRNNIGIFESTCTKPLLFPEKDARYHNKLRLSDIFKDFVRKALIKDPAKRLSIEDAIRHPWVQGVDASDHRLNKDVMHYLQQFSYQSKLKKEVTRVLAAQMTEEPSKQVLRHFKRLDADGDGFLDLEELTFLLLDMGYVGHLAQSEAVKMIQHADINKDGVLDFEEFKQVWYRKVLSTNDQYIHRVFDVFDDNGDGHIDSTELGQILFAENDELDNNMLVNMQNIIKEVDFNGDGKIDFEEFKNAMKEDLDSGKFDLFENAENEQGYGGLIGPKIVD